MLIPQQLTVEVGLPREPKLMRWVAVMARHPDEGHGGCPIYSGVFSLVGGPGLFDTGFSLCRS
jgi:hypothetical protein